MASKKKQILFIMNNLHCGGAEKALISLLQSFDYSRYDVDLLLFKKEGLFLKQLPQEVHLLDAPKEYEFFDMPLQNAVRANLSKGNFKVILNRICAGWMLKTEKNSTLSEQKLWRYLRASLPKLPKKYDVAIGYLEKNPLYYCVNNVDAAIKIGFIHNDYVKLGLNADVDRPYFQKLDKLVTISESCEAVLKTIFPDLVPKIDLMYNIVSAPMIKNMAEEKINEDFSGHTIVSVGRLNYQKAFEEAVVSCHYLVAKGLYVKWYILGEGPDRAEIEKRIANYQLQNHFILLGIKENPYPYVKQATVYAQPSRFEGKSIAIDEAKVLCKPILVTNFPSAKDQIKHGITGIIAENNPQAVAAELEQLLLNEVLRIRLTENLKSESSVDGNELQKMYEWFEMKSV